MNIGTAILVTVGLLIANAYFVAAEFAIMSARRSRIEPLAAAGKKSAKTVLYALENVTLMLATCQLGVTICSVALGAVSEPAIAHALEGPIAKLGLPSAAVHPIAFLIALLLVVVLHVVLGEMVPKNVAVTTPERAAMVLTGVLMFVSKLFMPIVASMNWLANHIIKIFGFEPKDEVASAFTADEVASIVEASKAAGVLDSDVDLLSGALEFSEHSASDVMVPLAEVATVPAGVTPVELEAVIAKHGFSRFPLASDDGVEGYVHLKDILDATEAQRTQPIADWKIRPLVDVDADDEVETALRAMQRVGTHMARVKRGGEVAGILFLEDVLEELVGEVRDNMQR